MTDRPDFSPTAVDVVLRPEWAAKEGTDKNFTAYVNPAAPGEEATVSYNVPAGKTVYITQVSFALFASAVANAELNQIGDGTVFNTTLGTVLWRHGGNGGGGISLAKPIVISAAHTVRFYATNLSGHNCGVTISASGYEV